MRIESDTKLDFHNVLIRPKRTTLSSRSQVNVERTLVRFLIQIKHGMEFRLLLQIWILQVHLKYIPNYLKKD